MQSDKYGNPIFQDNDIIDLIYKGHIDQLDQIIVNETVGIKQLAEYSEINLKTNSIVWGVGRGSSVASYVLFLLGVHKIDSVKYNLDWREFLR